MRPWQITVTLDMSGRPVHWLRVVDLPRRHLEAACDLFARIYVQSISSGRRRADKVLLLCPQCRALLARRLQIKGAERGLFDPPEAGETVCGPERGDYDD